MCGRVRWLKLMWPGGNWIGEFEIPKCDVEKELIKENWETLKNTPERIDDGVCIYDGGSQQYKFVDNYYD